MKAHTAHQRTNACQLPVEIDTLRRIPRTRRVSWPPRRCLMREVMHALGLLMFIVAVVSGAALAVAGEQPARPNVPGQAFHDWRTNIIAAKFTSSSRDSTAPSAFIGPSSSQSSTQQQHAEWINIVAAREALSVQRGLPSYTATHPAAKQRLQLAKALVALANADADADAKLPAEPNAARRQAFSQHQAEGAAAAGAASSTNSGSTGSSIDTSAAAARVPQHKHENTGGGAEAADRRKLHQQQPVTFGDLLQQATGAAAGSTYSFAGSATPIVPDTTPDRDLMLQQLTVLLRSQPYKPLQTDVAVLDSVLMHFVHKGPQGRLYVQDQPWLLKGFDVPEALQLAAGGPVTRSQMLYLLDRAQTLGLNTLRFRAFADGAPGVGSAVIISAAGQQEQGAGAESFDYVALQPAPGVLNGTMLREGLDWLVHECSLRGMRLLPVLTNGGSAEAGGMKQYIDWIDPALTVTAFYTNDTIKSVFLDHVAAILGHVNSLSGLPLREDPVILGWQLADDASHPGSVSSQTLLAWLRQVGGFIKQRAPRQLFLPGVKDLFGHNSPHHLQHNPAAQVFAPGSTSPHVYQPRCHGVDFWLHNQMPEVDATLAGVFPDMHVACNDTCKLDWTREWIRAHLRDAMRMNKPLILGGVGVIRPHTWRLQVLQLVQTEMERALQHGHPIGGVILSGLSHPDAPDETGWGTYFTDKGVQKARKPLDNLNAQAVRDAEWRHFMNYNSFMACQELLTRGVGNDKAEATNEPAWVDGWEDVVRAVADIGKLQDGAGMRKGLRSTT